jgi:putative PIG3 family NAD(P)H quinone oxidoreductase
MTSSSVALPATMLTISATESGGPEVLQPTEAPLPTPGAGQVLIAVKAAGVNRPDILQRQGFYPAPPGHSKTLGLEVAGEVAALGQGADAFNVGDRVMALVNGGGYAAYAVADEGTTLAIPGALSFEEAAGVPETFFTVWHNVFERGGLKSGETFLVHGGTSGIGVTAIQLAKAFGATVFTTAGSAAKCEACLSLGADRAINYNEEDFAAVIKEATSKRGCNLILDMVGGDYIEKNIRSLGDDGRLVNIGYQKGSKVTLDMMRVMLKRLTLTGSTLRIRSLDVKTGIAQAVAEKVLPLLQKGQVKVIIDRTFDIREASAAHAYMDSGQHIGKVILTVASPPA